MPKKIRWTETKIRDGVWEVELASWEYFSAFIHEEMLDYRGYVYRGQRSAAWKAESSLDRILRKSTRTLPSGIRGQHLRRFKFASRGRRGSNPPELKTDNDWWSLGQHQGLATPL